MDRVRNHFETLRAWIWIVERHCVVWGPNVRAVHTLAASLTAHRYIAGLPINIVSTGTNLQPCSMMQNNIKLLLLQSQVSAKQQLFCAQNAIRLHQTPGKNVIASYSKSTLRSI